MYFCPYIPAQNNTFLYNVRFVAWAQSFAWTRMASWLCCSSLPSVYQRLGISILRGGHKSGSILVSWVRICILSGLKQVIPGFCYKIGSFVKTFYFLQFCPWIKCAFAQLRLGIIMNQTTFDYHEKTNCIFNQRIHSQLWFFSLLKFLSLWIDC